MPQIAKSTCRCCPAYCPLNVTLEDGSVTKVEGNPEAPLFEGFICPKGRALTAVHNDPNRLLHSLKRMPDGSFQPISSEQLVEEISAKLKAIIEKDGPRSVAAYLGSPGVEQQAAAAMLTSFMEAIGSDSFFTSVTIDQPGVFMVEALHGGWGGGRIRPDKLDVFMIVGGNPVISKQYFPQDPGQQLKKLVKNKTKLIVIDPRRTETARRAHVHLQCIPGEDPTIIAGLIHLVIENGAVNKEFVAANTVGFEKLAEAVRSFTPAYAAERAGIKEHDLREAARLIGEAKRGDFGSGVGPSMATRGTLMSYLLRCLQTLRGFWTAEGDEAARPRVMMPRSSFKAQPIAPRPAWGFGRNTRVRGLQLTAAGMPTAALPEEILTPGAGQIKALFLHGGALWTWPQADLAKKALASLDLLVVHDTELSANASMASYIVATKKQFEMPMITQFSEVLGISHQGYGFVEPYAAYTPAVMDPPQNADALDAWQIYYRIARKLGLPLKAGGLFGSKTGPVPMLDMTHEPTTDDLFEFMCQDSAIPLSEIKKYPNGKVFDEARETVGPRDPDCTARLELANPYMMEELKGVRAESIAERRGTNREFPFLMIPRRVQNTTNTFHPPGLLKTIYNPAYMHSSDIEKLGLKSGDMVEISSRHGAIVGFVESDDDLRIGTLSMCHGFGKTPGKDYDPRRDGANINELLHWGDDYDPYIGMPRMSAVPIAVKALQKSNQRQENAA